MPARRRRSQSSGKGVLEKSWGKAVSVEGSVEDLLDGVGEAGPGRGEIGEAARSGGGEGVIDAAAAVDWFALGGEGAVALEVVEDGVDDAFAEGDGGSGAVADGLHEFITVHLAALEERKDEELWDSIHEVRIGFAGGHGREYTLRF
jgi:hypothetical protein